MPLISTHRLTKLCMGLMKHGGSRTQLNKRGGRESAKGEMLIGIMVFFLRQSSLLVKLPYMEQKIGYSGCLGLQNFLLRLGVVDETPTNLAGFCNGAVLKSSFFFVTLSQTPSDCFPRKLVRVDVESEVCSQQAVYPWHTSGRGRCRRRMAVKNV